MKQLKIIPSDYICQLWDQIKHYFEKVSGIGNNDYTVDQIKYLLVQGKQTLFVIMEEEKLIGTFTVEVINYPNHRVAHTTTMGGKGLFDKDTVKQYEDWARSQGVNKIRAFAQAAQARLYRMKMGLNMVTHVVEKTI
jgi:hypothetical protein